MNSHNCRLDNELCKRSSCPFDLGVRVSSDLKLVATAGHPTCIHHTAFDEANREWRESDCAHHNVDATSSTCLARRVTRDR